MKVKVEDVGACRKIIQVEVPADTVASEYSEILKAYTKVARIPGFRTGRAPLAIVENRFAKDIVEEAKERLVPQYYWKAVEEEKITPVAIVEISEVIFGKEQGLAFKATIDVAPDFKLPKYRKISLSKREVEIGDKDIDSTVERIKANFSRFEDANDREVRRGDLVRIDFTGTCDGVSIGSLSPDSAPIGEGKDFWVFMGEPEFLPGFSDNLVGLKINDKKVVNIHFPADFRVKSVSGKDVIYDVTVKGVRVKIMPEMNAEFFKKLEVDSMEALRSKIRNELLENAKHNEDLRLKEEIAKSLLEKADFDLPKSVVDHETAASARSIVERIATQGATREQIEHRKDDILSEATKTSTDRVRLSYILSRIADEEKIEVQDAELESRIEILASRYGMSVARFRAEIEKRDGINKLKGDMRAEKTLDFLLQNSKIK
ncbi:MAG: trigger factor [Kiritimatiellae bacterium]|nr:trigger factor [Kiritimatiellia bacterium]MDD5522279.1 trigger factor [Kiritimatiellia bacterium]